MLYSQLETVYREQKKQTINVKVDQVQTERSAQYLGSKITKKYGKRNWKTTHTVIVCNGGGGQSFGAFIPKGLTLELEGDSNDYFGKGLSGGKAYCISSERKHLQGR